MIYGHSECLHAALAGVSDYHEKILYLILGPISGVVSYSSATYTRINTVFSHKKFEIKNFSNNAVENLGFTRKKHSFWGNLSLLSC